MWHRGGGGEKKGEEKKELKVKKKVTLEGAFWPGVGVGWGVAERLNDILLAD